MLTTKLRKLASKVIALMMAFTVINPLASNVSLAANVNGNLIVGFNNANGGFSVTNVLNQEVASGDSGACPYQSGGPYAGYFVCQQALQLGTYKVTFTDVTDYTTPDAVDVALNELGYTTMGTYVPENVPQTGVLGIAVNNIEGGYLITNVLNQQVADVDADSCGPLQNDGYYHCSQSLAFGTYTVTYKDVQGYTPPDTVSVPLGISGAEIVGDYQAQVPTTGVLEVGVNNVNGGYVITNVLNVQVGNVNANTCGAPVNGYYICKQTLPLGTYTVTFKAVNGYTTPNVIHVALGAGTNQIWGTYTAQAPQTGKLTVGINLAQGGYTITNVLNVEVANVSPAQNCGVLQNGYYLCSQTLPQGTYTVKFNTVNGYNTPADIHVALSTSGANVWGYYSTQPTGVIQILVVDQNNQPINNLPAGQWQLKRCVSADPNSCADTLTSGGPGGVYDNLLFATYRIVFPNPTLPAGYTARVVLPSAYQSLDANNTSRTFVIQYTKQVISTEDAYVNVRTAPVKAAVRMDVITPVQPSQNGITSHEVNPLPIYDLVPADRFTLPTSGGVTASTDYTVTCLPAPGDQNQAYHAPANPITVTDAVYNAGLEYLAGTCVYTTVPADQQVRISVDTIGVDQAAIYVDGVEVRPTTSNAETFVWITTTEAHTISFEDKDPTHFLVPPAIAIPANSLNSSMTPAQLKYLGYYVALGNLATAEVNTENANGWVYLKVGNDPTLWNVGYATTDTNHPLIVHFDENVSHEFNFQDRNAPANPSYYLRAVPTSAAGFTVNQTLSQDANGNVTYFQERYTYTAPQALTTVTLIGDYIAYTNAAFFRARTTNADPVYGNIYLDINGEAPETLRPGAQTWTRVFISDVVNDSDATRFESPITVNMVGYTANPPSYDLSAYNPGPAVNDLESTYVQGVTPSNLIVQLISPDPNHQPTAGLIVTLDNSVNQPTVNNAGSIEATFANVNATTDHTVQCPDIAGLTTPNDLNIPAGTLQPGNNTRQCVYASATTSAFVLVETEASDNVNFEAPIVLSVDGTDYPVGYTVNDGNPTTPATLCLLVDTAHLNVIEYGAMAGYNTPAADTVNVVAGTDCTNPANVVNGLYTRPTNDRTVTITAWDGANVLNTADIIVNSVTVSNNGQYTHAYPVGTVLNISFENVAGYGTPEVRINGTSIGNTYSTQYTVLDNPSPNTVDAYYTAIGNNVQFNVTTRDNAGNALTQNIVHGPNGNETTVATPANFQVGQPVTAYTINFTDRAGYVTPGPVVVAGNAIAAIPASVTITDNGTAYVAGAQLVAGHTYAIVGTYIPYFTIDKTVVLEQASANNNKRVDYRITITRSASSPNGAMSITLNDSIAPSRTLTGSNGGTMSVVPQGTSYSTCSNACGDITAGSVTVNTSNPGAVVTITYQLLSNNTGVPAGQSSNFTNNLTGSFTHNAQTVNLTDSAVVTVAAPPSSNGSSSGGGGGGGGAILIKGDMILEVTKLASLDKLKWVDASDEEEPLVIPSNVDSTLYTKVTIKNLGQVTATNIKYSEGFDEGDSKITTEDIENVEGSDITFNDTTNVITIDQLKVGEETGFTYQQKLHEDGSKGQLAEEYLVLDGFSTKLSKNQDGLTKHGIGDHYPTWLTAGKPGVPTAESPLALYIRTDKSSAKVGEEVVYTITAKNNADYDFTGTTISWAYDPKALEILNGGAGRNTGTEIHWTKGTLKPGETATYTVRVKVKGTAPVGGSVRTTARGLVNEIEDPAMAEHFLSIIAGTSTPVKLAQTGASTFGLILLSIFAYIVYMNTGKRRYLALRKEALRPL